MARGDLSRDRILAEAQRAVDEHGIDSLSMRRLAQRLDVWPMSIYTYFRDKDELLDALAESAAAAVELPQTHTSWRWEMRALLHEARRVSTGGLVASRLPVALLSPGLVRITHAGLAILERAGLDRDEAASAWRTLLSYTFGFALTSLADAPPLPRELAAALAAEGEFDRGLARLLDGIAPTTG